MRAFLVGREVEPAVERAFERHCDELTARASPWLLALFVGFVVIWWPTDFVIFAEHPDLRARIGLMRAFIVVHHAFWLTLGRHALRRRPGRWGPVIVFIDAWFVAYLAGRQGGFDTPWPYSIYIWPLTSVALARPLAVRAPLVFAIGAGMLGFCVLGAGTPLDHPALPSTVSYLTFCCLFAVLIGHGMWLVLRANFVQRRQIEAQRERLDGFRQALEDRVAAQTHDLQVLTRRLETLREEERRWMARELHDALGQELTGARYALDLVRTRLSGENARLDGALADVHGRLGLAHESVRLMLQRLRPRVLDELGVAAALAWLCDDFARRVGVEVEFTAEPPGARMSPRLETALYRVAAEALSNVDRHAGASRVEVRLVVGAERCVLTVEDDGVGFDPDAATSAGAGLIGIRERLVALGGRAVWGPRSGGGAALRVEAPMG